MCCTGRRGGGGLKALLFGMLVGLVLGLVFAPKPGSETINQVSGRVTGKMPS